MTLTKALLTASFILICGDPRHAVAQDHIIRIDYGPPGNVVYVDGVYRPFLVGDAQDGPVAWAWLSGLESEVNWWSPSLYAAQIGRGDGVLAGVDWSHTEACIAFDPTGATVEVFTDAVCGMEMQRLWAFLAAYFAGDIAADFDRSGSLGSGDVLAYIERWLG